MNNIMVALGNNPLMRWLYEIEAPPGAQSPASLWRYRAQVTVEHLTTTLDHQFEGKPGDTKPRILREFLREVSSSLALFLLIEWFIVVFPVGAEPSVSSIPASNSTVTAHAVGEVPSPACTARSCYLFCDRLSS